MTSKMACTYKLHWHLLMTIVKSECPVQWIEWSLTNECPNHNIVYRTILIWITFSLTQSLGLWWGQTLSKNEKLSIKLIKAIITPCQQYENITYSSIAYWMHSSILFCCTETNNILRAVSSSEDAVFSMRTFTWSWCLPASGICRSAHRVDWWAGLHFSTRFTSTYLRNRHVHAVEIYTRTMVFWIFSSTYFSAIWRLTSSSWYMS